MSKNKNKEVSGLLIDVEEGFEQVETLDELDLERFYDLLNCRCIDITDRVVDGETFTFVVDDEGLLKDNPVVSAVNSKREPMLVGNLFVCKKKGPHLESLSAKDIEILYENMLFSILNDPEGFKTILVLGNVEYIQ